MNLKVSFPTLLWPFCQKIQHQRPGPLILGLFNCRRSRLGEGFKVKKRKCVKSVHLLQAIQCSKQAWDEIDSGTIRNYFKKVLYIEKSLVMMTMMTRLKVKI